MAMKRVIGLMSGTSMDGIDAVLMETDGEAAVAVSHFLSVPYDDAMRKKIRLVIAEVAQLDRIDNRAAGVSELSDLLTNAHYKVVQKLLKEAEVSADKIDLVGFHGHTILHRPEQGFTWQIGDGEALAHQLGIGVVSDFRSSDVAHGGQGAPLVPLYHRAIMLDHAPKKTIAVLNLGGVGNVTWIDFSAEGDAILAFDTGPGNALIDDWMNSQTGERFDRDGEVAARGTANSDYLLAWMSHPYFLQPAPKSLDRNGFSVEGIENLSVADGAASLSAFTVAAAKMAVMHMPKEPEAWYVCGGGRKNKTLMTLLKAVLDATVEPIEKLGFNGDAIEAEAFAYLAVRSLKGLPTSLPSTTGASMAVSGGTYHRP